MAGGSGRSYFYFAFHTVCFIINIIGCYYDFNNIKLPAFDIYGGRLKFLTHWCQYIHFIYFGFVVMDDAVRLILSKAFDSSGDNSTDKTADKSTGLSKNQSLLSTLKDYFFVTVCFPVGVMVCFLFWAITLKDRDGVTPSETRKLIPLNSLYNHYLHTFPLILDCIGIFFISFKFPKRMHGISVVSLIAVSYIAWLVHIGNYTGFWCYPFIEHQTTAEFIAFVAASTATVVGVYIFEEKLSSVVWKEVAEKDA